MLNDIYNSDQAEFFVLYGKRRVGKTELLMQFCKDKTSIYYCCEETTDAAQLSLFSEAVMSFNKDTADNAAGYPIGYPVGCFATFNSWTDAFRAVANLCGNLCSNLCSNEKLVLVLDEFPYMVKGNRNILSLLQKLWDMELRSRNIMIILSGSTMSFMGKELLSYRNPLYGRINGHYRLEPLPCSDAVRFFPDYSDEDKLLAYSILGGVPYYLEKFSGKLTLKQNIERNILMKGSPLYDTVNTVLREELREPAIYNRIIEVIAAGTTQFNVIKEKTQIDSRKLSVYLANLIEIGIITKEYPFNASDSDRTNVNSGRYHLVDDFFRFWYRYAFPNKTLPERRNTGLVLENIMSSLHNFASKAFERASIDYMNDLDNRNLLPFRLQSIGRWWGNITETIDGKKQTSSVEIDLVASNEQKNQFILGECKLRNAPFNIDQLEALEKKCAFRGQIYYYLFSLCGYTEEVQQSADTNPNIVLVSIHDVLNINCS